MKKTQTILICLIALGVILTITGLCITPTVDAYSGRVVFNTESDYSQFKQVLADQDVDISDMTVLSSAPPILVQFNQVQVSHNIYFPYGEKQFFPHWLFIVGAGLAIGMLFMLALSYMFGD
jgi:hypothetical protein